MAGHSRPKDGVALLAYVPAIHALLYNKKDVDARHKAGHDVDRPPYFFCALDPASARARAFLSSIFMPRAIWMRWACGEPAPCRLSVR